VDIQSSDGLFGRDGVKVVGKITKLINERVDTRKKINLGRGKSTVKNWARSERFEKCDWLK
jgi:hypothetical protein